MKKLVLLFILIYNLVASTQIENNTPNTNNIFTKIEKEYIKSNTITLGMISDYYPFSFKENGKIEGFSYDYINLIIKKSGLKINFEMDNWSNLLNKFKNKQIDMIDVISYKKDRESYTNFSKPYFHIPNVMFARKGEFNDYEGLESLKGKRIAINKDVYYYDTLKELNLFELIEFKNSKNKMKALAYGKVDVVFSTLVNGQKHIKEGTYYNIKILQEFNSRIIKKEDLRIGITKHNQVLFSIIQKSMNSITRKEKEVLINKWFAAKIEVKNTKNTVQLTETEKQYLKEKKQINMCIDPNWMPFESFDENGKHIGMSAEYYKIFSKKLNTKIKVIKTKTWNESLQKVKNRKCDILSLAMKTPNREKYLNFTTPYLTMPLVIATKLDVSFINNIEAIKGKNVGITKGYAFVEILRKKYTNLNIIEVESIDDGLTKVNKGELFGYIGSLATISHQFQRGLSGELKIAGKLDENWKLGIAIRNDDKTLFSIFEKVIQNTDKKKEQQILNNWISIKYEKGTDYTIVWYLLIAGSILISLFMYRQYSLKKANKTLQIAVDKKTKDLQVLNESLAAKIKEEVEKNLYIQEKLFKSEKLASMGEMIGNIAHQWRQPLSIISMGATGMQMQKKYDLLTDEIFDEICTDINNNVQYLSNTIDDFKNFIKGDRKKVTFNLDEGIHSFITLVKGSAINDNINLVLDIQKDINLFGYPNELIQCLMNIFNNSRDALNEKNIKNKYIFISTLIEDNKTIIKIKDNAGGIPVDILPRIFEPYFTTKHRFKGTGIGLHMTYNLIVTSMEGKIEASNKKYIYEEKEYVGAEFKLSLSLT